MLEQVIHYALHRRWLVLGLVLLLVGLGAWNFTRLPIDAVPDITNVQVVVNTYSPGYTPLEVEQRVTFPLEISMAGLPRLQNTRSLSRYGLSQITVVFEEGTDIYFARQHVAERVNAARAELPDSLEPSLGPISTGLGEIFMFTVDCEPGVNGCGRVADHADGSAHRTRLDHQAAASARTRRRGGQSDRRLQEGNPRGTRSGQAACLRPGLR